jgi:hypothetical protein
MSITYYSIAKNIFAASSGEISALRSFIEPSLADLDHADRANTSRDRTSQQAYIFNCEWITELAWDESVWSNYD